MPHPAHPRRTAVRLAVAAAVALVTLVGSTPPAYAGGGRTVTVLTRNLYFGGDLTPSVTAPDLPAFLAANAALLAHVDRTDFPARARLVAREIRDHRPDLVGLQEVALWRTGPLGDPQPATDVRYDFLAILTAALRATGQRYEVAVVQDEADLEAPAGAPFGLDVRLTVRDVVLIRHGGPVRATGVSSGSFATNLVATIPATGGTATITRGWAAVDAVVGARRFRFVTTHLDAVAPAIRAAQAQELLAGPLNRPGRMILVGDLNSGPDQVDPAQRLGWATLVAGGMVDTWPLLHPFRPGHTADLGDDLDQPADSLEHRIDMVLVRGPVVPVYSRLFGNRRHTPAGLWASDHLGHAAALWLR